MMKYNNTNNNRGANITTYTIDSGAFSCQKKIQNNLIKTVKNFQIVTIIMLMIMIIIPDIFVLIPTQNSHH